MEEEKEIEVINDKVPLINDVFIDLKEVGQAIHYLALEQKEDIRHEEPDVFAEIAVGLMVDRLKIFNRAMTELTEIFNGLDFEPLET